MTRPKRTLLLYVLVLAALVDLVKTRKSIKRKRYESGWWKESYNVPIIVRGPGGNFIVGREIDKQKRTITKNADITENQRLPLKRLHSTNLLRILILKKIEELLLEKNDGEVQNVRSTKSSKNS
eukprot:TCONS_00001700-protein